MKRRFYYHLKRKFKDKSESLVKSSILLPTKFEEEADSFFMDWRGYLTVYKVKTESIERILEETPL